MRLGIDASNLSLRGGGATHLRGVLNAARPDEHGCDEVVVFASQSLLNSLPTRHWLRTAHHPWLDRGLAWRTAWQNLKLTSSLRRQGCDLLFAPCGNYIGSFHPYVAMSHNLLLFEQKERRRFGLSWMRLKLKMLSQVQQRCFNDAAGLVLISEYAKRCIAHSVERDLNDVPVIYHGVGEHFVNRPKVQSEISEYSAQKPFRLLYVSTVSAYKHQDQLVHAFARLVEEGFPIRLDLVGGAYGPALKKLQSALKNHPRESASVTYHGSVPIDKIQMFYQQADGFVFASTCENMPNILVEAMQSGLPICCSDQGPMPEILGDCGLYFSPESQTSIANSIRQLLNDAEQRQQLATAAFEAAQQFRWDACAQQTFEYFRKVNAKVQGVSRRTLQRQAA